MVLMGMNETMLAPLLQLLVLLLLVVVVVLLLLLVVVVVLLLVVVVVQVLLVGMRMGWLMHWPGVSVPWSETSGLPVGRGAQRCLRSRQRELLHLD